MKADEVRLYALRGGLKKQAVCYTHFHISKAKVYELIHDKKIKGFLIGRKFRVLKKEVIRFINTVPII